MIGVERSLKVLIAEDSNTDRLILESIIEKIGHQPVAVADGLEAVKAYERERPDIVLLDVLMPNMGGMEAASAIRQASEGEIVPILFLTSLTDTESIVECLEAGGDDFVSKPYNATVLQSKIRSFGRMREMHNTLAAQKKALEINHKHLMQEQTVAKQVFDKIAHTGCLELENIRYHMSPLAVFNGDVLVAEVSPTGSMLVLLGDFTGHGLPAAIGSMPLASIFYGMAHKGFSISEIIREINSRLHDILPIGFFCCATCIDINFMKRRLRVWNGGLPDSFLYRKSSNTNEVVSTNNLPLGVLSNSQFKAETTRIDLEIGDRFYMYSDGITEARNEKGEMFGEDRLLSVLEAKKGRDDLFDSIIGEVQNHIGAFNKEDDVSLVEITIDDKNVEFREKTSQASVKGSLVDWSMTFDVSETTMKGFDPLPLLVNVISEVPGLRQNSTILYTIISELYANALEHGVLNLPSTLKSSPQGFAEFYQIRREKLDKLEKANITFKLVHEADEDGGLLKIRVIDSGKGFCLSITADSEENGQSPSYYGRGMSIMNSVCEQLVVHPPGNDVEVHFRWKYEE